MGNNSLNNCTFDNLLRATLSKRTFLFLPVLLSFQKNNPPPLFLSPPSFSIFRKKWGKFLRPHLFIIKNGCSVGVGVACWHTKTAVPGLIPGGMFLQLQFSTTPSLGLNCLIPLILPLTHHLFDSSKHLQALGVLASKQNCGYADAAMFPLVLTAWKDHGHLSLKVQYVEFNIDVKFQH